MDLPPHPDPRAPGRVDVRGETTRQDRSNYEPPPLKEAFSPAEPEKSGNSHHGPGEQRELEKTESVDGKKIKVYNSLRLVGFFFFVVLNRTGCFPGDDDGKDDEQSVASVGEEYEPISDDELDEILADSQKKDDQQEEEKSAGTAEPRRPGRRRFAGSRLRLPPQVRWT